MYTDNTTILNVTTGTTGGVHDVSNRSLKSIQFINTASTAGVATFTVHVSNDGESFVAYNRLISNATTDAKVANIALSSLTTSGMLFIPQDDIFRYIRVTVSKSAQIATVNGTYQAIMQTYS
jgi:hypothetical protein